jgi:dUTP pyrophosphatase
MDLEYFYFHKLTDKAMTPQIHGGSIGIDLISPYEYTIKSMENRVCNTDLSIQLPAGCYGRIADRSSMAMKGLIVGGGVIDANYIGNVGVIIFNLGKEDYTIKRGDKIAQLICEYAALPDVAIESQKPFEPTNRDGGFGSSGR